jgi:hypothetical protein
MVSVRLRLLRFRHALLRGGKTLRGSYLRKCLLHDSRGNGLPG